MIYKQLSSLDFGEIFCNLKKSCAHTLDSQEIIHI